jgi:hypothetical protein
MEKQMVLLFVIGAIVGALALYGASSITGYATWKMAMATDLDASGLQGQDLAEAEVLARTAVKDRNMGSQIAATLKAHIALDKAHKALLAAHPNEVLRVVWDIKSSDTYGGMHDLYAVVLKNGAVHKMYSEELLAKLNTELHAEILAGKMFIAPYEVSRAVAILKVIDEGSGNEKAVFGSIGTEAAREALGMVRQAILETQAKDAVKEALAAEQILASDQVLISTSKMFGTDLSSEPMMVVSVAVFDQGVLNVAKSGLLANTLNSRILLNERLNGKCLVIGAGNHEGVFAEALREALQQFTPSEARSVLIDAVQLLIDAGGIVPLGTGGTGQPY